MKTQTERLDAVRTRRPQRRRITQPGHIFRDDIELSDANVAAKQQEELDLTWEEQDEADARPSWHRTVSSGLRAPTEEDD